MHNQLNESNSGGDRLAIVADIYAAFGRGDMAGVLAPLADDVDWEYAFGHNEVPWLQRQRGKDGVAAFFAALGAHVRFVQFVPKELLQGRDKVVVLIDLELEVPATGGRVREEDEVHIWHFDADGKVCRFRHVLDTLQHQRAFVGE